MKKIVSLLLILTLIFSFSLTQVFAATVSDISGKEYEEAATTLMEYGVITGYPDGTFKGENPVTRAEFTVMLIRALGMEKTALESNTTSDFKDVPSHWAKDYINFAAKQGIVKGQTTTTFAPEANVKFSEAVTMQLRAMGIPFTETQGKYWYLGAMSKAGELKILQSSMVVPEDPALRGDIAMLLYNGLDIKMASGKTMREVLTEEEAPEDLQVKDIVTVGLKQIEVSFTNKVDAQTALSLDNYTFSSDKISVSKALLKDEYTVILALENAVADYTECQMGVRNVTDLQGGQMEDAYIKDIVFIDKEVPTVESVVIVGPYNMEVTFSEPIASFASANIMQENGKYLVKNIEMAQNDTVAYIENYNKFEGDVSVEIIGAVDYKGYKSEKATFKATSLEGEKLEVVNYSMTTDSITLYMNKQVKTKNLNIRSIYNVEPENYASKVSVERNKVVIGFKENGVAKYTQGNLVIPANTIADLWDAGNDKIEYAFTLDMDVIPPMVESMERVENNQLKFNFSEKIQKPTAENFRFYQNGQEVYLVQSITTNATEPKSVYVNIVSSVSGDIEIRVENYKDLNGNKGETYTASFNIVDTTAPDFKNFRAYIYNPGAEGQTVVIDFGKEMMTYGKYAVNDLEKYNVAGKDLRVLAQKAKVEMTVSSDNTKLEIKIPSLADDPNGININPSATLTMARVADKWENYTEELVGTLEFIYEKYMTIKSVTAIESNKIQVEFNDYLTTCQPNDIRFTYSGSSALAYTSYDIDTNEEGNTVVTYTLGKAISGNGTYQGNEVRAYIISASSKNQYGQTLQTGIYVPLVDKIGPSLVKDASGSLKAVRDSDTTIKLYFDENIKESTLSTLSFSVEGARVNYVDTTFQDFKSDVVVIHFDPGTATPDNPTVSINGQFTDENGNLYKGARQVTAKKAK